MAQVEKRVGGLAHYTQDVVIPCLLDTCTYNCIEDAEGSHVVRHKFREGVLVKEDPGVVYEVTHRSIEVGESGGLQELDAAVSIVLCIKKRGRLANECQLKENTRKGVGIAGRELKASCKTKMRASTGEC